MERYISGAISFADGSEPKDLVVQAFDKKTLRSEVFLGEALTDGGGGYQITYQLEPQPLLEGDSVDLIIRVFDAAGFELGKSEVLFDAEEEGEIDLVVEPHATGAEHEQLEASLDSLLEDVPPRALDEDQVTFLSQATGLDDRQIRDLRTADALGDETGLPVPVLYALVRQGTVVGTPQLAVLSDAALSQAVDEAVTSGILGEGQRGLLAAARQALSAFRREQAERTISTDVTHRVIGRLVDAEGEPQAGLVVRAADFGGAAPVSLGYDVSDRRGLFGFHFTTPADAPPDPEGRSLELRVIGRDGVELHEATVQAIPDPSQVFDLAITPQVEPPETTDNLDGLELELDPDLLSALADQGIETLAGVRAAGGLQHLEDLPVSSADPSLVAIESHAQLEMVIDDAAVRNTLIDNGIPDVPSLGGSSREGMITYTYERMPESDGANAWSGAGLLNHLSSNIFAGLGSKAALDALQDEAFEDLLEKLQPKQCGCKDCEAATSPLAYLAELLDYTVRNVKDAGQLVDLGSLTQTFHQPFGDLPTACDQVDVEVSQVRLAVEVLRRYLAAEQLPASGSAEESRLIAAESAYALDAYRELLEAIGTSYHEIRRARTETPERRRQLAERLGIELAPERPDELDALFLDAETENPEVHEAALEQLFGLVDTTRDPLLDGPTPDVLSWRRARLAALWRLQDRPETSVGEGRPLIDPDVVGPADLRHPQAGQPAFDLWQARRDWVDARLAELQDARDENGLVSVLEAVFGTPLPDFDTLRADLETGTDPAGVASQIEALGLTVESFIRLTDLRAREASPDPAQHPDEDEWGEIYAILVRSEKVGLYTTWSGEEEAAGLLLDPAHFWIALEEPELVPWLADPASRAAWQYALTVRSRRPLIDPDLIGPGDFVSPLAGSPAFDLWNARRQWIQGRLIQLAADREAAAAEVDGLDAVATSSLAIDAAEWAALLADAEAGVELDGRLAQLSLPADALSYLARIRALAADQAPVLDSEWAEVYSILAQVEKRRAFAIWRDQEANADLAIEPATFRVPEPPALAFPPAEPPALPRWRATRSDKRDFEDRLAARVEQLQGAEDALAGAVSKTEAATLPALRDALAWVSNAAGTSFEERASWIEDRLLIDLRADGCQRTTRVAQATHTLQGLLWSVRNRLLNDTYPDLELVGDDFDEAWRWIGSYATWRTAMLVFLYPENIAVPSLRRHSTPAFRQLVSELRGNRRLSPEQAQDAAAVYADYFKDVARLRLETSCQTRTRIAGKDGHEGGYGDVLYLFARGGATGTFYVSTLDPEDGSGYAQSSWRPVPGLTDVVSLVGVAPFELPGEEHFLYLFARVREKGHQKLVFVRYDLERRAWDPDATELDLPAEATSFTARVMQAASERRPPQVAVRLPHGAVFHRLLNGDGTDWEESDWRLLIGQGYGVDTLDAMIQTEDGGACLVATVNGEVTYRLYGAANDGRWRTVAPGVFRGAFRWPGDSRIYVFFGSGVSSGYRIIDPSESDGENEVVTSVAELDSWLRHAAGADLRAVPVEDGPYAGESLYDLLTLETEEDPNTWSVSVLDLFRHRAVHHLMSKAHEADETDRRYGPWKMAARFVAWLSSDNVSLATALLRASQGAATEFRHRDDTAEASAEHAAVQGLGQLAPIAGAVEDPALRTFVYSRTAGQPGLYGCRYGRLPDGSLIEEDTRRMAPRVTGPFGLPSRLSESKLQFRRALIKKAFEDNQDASASILAYLEEAYFFVPMQLSQEMQSRGHFTAALDWLRSVYDYSMPVGLRKIYHGLVAPQDGGLAPYDRAEDWLLDPLDPHRIAASRVGAYTRFTLLALVRCLLAYADSEFTRDTSESVARARLLYLTALEVLGSSDLLGLFQPCDDQVGSLETQVGDDLWRPVLAWLQQKLGQLGDPIALSQTVEGVRQQLNGSGPWEDRFAAADALVEQALAAQPASLSFAELMSESAELAARFQLALESVPAFSAAGRRVVKLGAKHFYRSLSLVTGIPSSSLIEEPVELPWLREKWTYGPIEGGTVQSLAPSVGYEQLTLVDPLSPSHIANLGELAKDYPLLALDVASPTLNLYAPSLSLSFCIPPNPVIKMLQLRAELELYKLRTCRNIAGLERQLEPYAAPTDTVSGLPVIGAGGQLSLPGLTPLMPTPYRYPVLIERARRLTSLAQQVESSMLASLEKGDAERYSRLKARQDVQMARSGVRLQALRVREARTGVTLAELQRQRSEILVETYGEWLDGGFSLYEELTLGLLAASAALSFASAAANWTTALSSLASGTSATASIFSNLASYERRRQEWELQQALAEQDVRIGAEQVALAHDRVRVVEQERVIAELSVDQARDVVEFLGNKFTSAELYDWMSGVLEGVYAFLLQQATATAQLASAQLAFERQETPPPFLQQDYWRPPADGLDEEGSLDRRGLTGSARLLRDLELLDQHAFDTAERPLQLSKTISLAQLVPAELQRFRETGVLTFATPMELFDHDFPGHYLRRIRQVRTSVVALIPPVQGIRATLTSGSASRVVVGGDVFQEAIVSHGPQSVALTSPRDASGVFELDTHSEMLLPFEGMGVDATWELRLPRAANPFDFATLADVLLTIEYTALDSFLYRQQVIQSLPSKTSGDRPFSFRHQLADAWYDLHNPEQSATPMTVRFTTTREDFPPHLDDLEIEHLVLYFVRGDGETFEVPVEHFRFHADGAPGPVGGGAVTTGGVVSTRRGNAGGWLPILGREPFGQWELSLPDTAEVKGRFESETIEDILFVVTYRGRTPEWPA